MCVIIKFLLKALHVSKNPPISIQPNISEKQKETNMPKHHPLLENRLNWKSHTVCSKLFEAFSNTLHHWDPKRIKDGDMVSGVNSPMKNLLSKEFKLFYEMVSSRGRRTKRKRGETHTKNQLRKTPRKG